MNTRAMLVIAATLAASISGCANTDQRCALDLKPPLAKAVVAAEEKLANHCEFYFEGYFEQLMALAQPERDKIEDSVASRVAIDLIERLPRTPAEFEQFIERGYALAQKMSWDVVARDYVLPGITRAAKAQRLRQIA